MSLGFVGELDSAEVIWLWIVMLKQDHKNGKQTKPTE